MCSPPREPKIEACPRELARAGTATEKGEHRDSSSIK